MCRIKGEDILTKKKISYKHRSKSSREYFGKTAQLLIENEAALHEEENRQRTPPTLAKPRRAVIKLKNKSSGSDDINTELIEEDLLFESIHEILDSIWL